MNDARDLLRQAYIVAKGSPDPRTQNGALLVFSDSILAQACNTYPFGVARSSDRLERPLKYQVIEHAERNAIYAAARAGQRTLGATMYCPWAACADCARAIIQAGIYRLVRHADANGRHRGEDRSTQGRGIARDQSISIADQMLLEAGVLVQDIEGKLTDFEIMHAGERWSP